MPVRGWRAAAADRSFPLGLPAACRHCVGPCRRPEANDGATVPKPARGTGAIRPTPAASGNSGSQGRSGGKAVVTGGENLRRKPKGVCKLT